MKISKATVVGLFRSFGLMHMVDKTMYFQQSLKNKKANQAFKSKYPQLNFPPDYILFESFGLNYEKYYKGGKESALWIKEKIERHIDLKNKRILDWGCGPARIIRHLPEMVGNDCQYFGTDYNPVTIKWCSSKIEGITFNRNNLNPPMTYVDNSFDVIYGISIFTHLSAKNHESWAAELYRILQKNGILMITSHGQAFEEKLTSSEAKRYNEGKLITRGRAIEGHRVYTAFQPPKYMKNLLESKGFKIMDHLIGVKQHWGIEQDTWILKKE